MNICWMLRDAPERLIDWPSHEQAWPQSVAARHLLGCLSHCLTSANAAQPFSNDYWVLLKKRKVREEIICWREKKRLSPVYVIFQLQKNTCCCVRLQKNRFLTTNTPLHVCISHVHTFSHALIETNMNICRCPQFEVVFSNEKSQSTWPVTSSWGLQCGTKSKAVKFVTQLPKWSDKLLPQHN